MFERNSTRREFLKYGNLSILFVLSSCSNNSQNVTVAIQNSLYPDSFRDTIPNAWLQKNLNFININPDKNNKIISASDYVVLNDGWINKINFTEFREINEFSFFEKMNKRSREYLNTFQEKQRNKLFPIGIVPYAIVIKNNKELIKSARKSWNFLLSRKLKEKIIFPESPRIFFSIAERINSTDSLAKLKRQAMVFDDKNALNWLINSDACVAIVPYSTCSKYLKVDPRLSIVFPNQGVPLMWHFLLIRSNLKSRLLVEWIELLESKSNVNKLSSQGWYLPFKNNYFESKHNSMVSGPSQECWNNSWSFSTLTKLQKTNFEEYWNNSLTP